MAISYIYISRYDTSIDPVTAGARKAKYVTSQLRTLGSVVLVPTLLSGGSCFRLLRDLFLNRRSLDKPTIVCYNYHLDSILTALIISLFIKCLIYVHVEDDLEKDGAGALFRVFQQIIKRTKVINRELSVLNYKISNHAEYIYLPFYFDKKGLHQQKFQCALTTDYDVFLTGRLDDVRKLELASFELCKSGFRVCCIAYGDDERYDMFESRIKDNNANIDLYRNLGTAEYIKKIFKSRFALSLIFSETYRNATFSSKLSEFIELNCLIITNQWPDNLKLPLGVKYINSSDFNKIIGVAKDHLLNKEFGSIIPQNDLFVNNVMQDWEKALK